MGESRSRARGTGSQYGVDLKGVMVISSSLFDFLDRSSGPAPDSVRQRTLAGLFRIWIHSMAHVLKLECPLARTPRLAKFRGPPASTLKRPGSAPTIVAKARFILSCHP